MRTPKPWTPEEDEILRNEVAREVADPTQINWLQVATRLSARNNKDCRKRWVYTLAPTVKKGAWDEQEDNALREGTRIYGTKWSEVARVVGTRQPDQCSRRWHEAIKPNISRQRWSLYE
ncbi:putative Myb-like protein A [Glarea lozoyensis 74030]|uniref:Putative Myb-like protein A n=1 Tax=Glarea lozoyensis (strain ATCC 74030 / MF5533) TaxID=1104152 RepID=H0EWB2_GLAL7|nr:putative Myb-like protein A [Glarea lozoyensis 74030]